MLNSKFFSTRWTLHRIHKWLGLIAGIWLVVLGFTGFLLDHRDTWQWLWQGGISETLLNSSVIEKSKTGQIRLYQINPENYQQHITGGLTGLWWSNDSGKNWLKTNFINVERAPMISTVLFSSKNKVWISSDNGLWLSINNGKSAQQVVLAGRWVSSFSINKNTQLIIGVVERSKIFNYKIDNEKLDFIDIKPVNIESLPKSITLSRFIRDIHYGRGIFYIPLSLMWNDISAIAMITLPLTGFLFYWLPKRWRRDKEQHKRISHKIKKQSMRWLFRLHGPTFGLISAIPFIYLSLSGILLDHGKELRGWMKSVQVIRSWQTPVYNLNSWHGEIYGIVGYKENIEKISVATRLGLFTSINNGETWQREKLLGDKSLFVWSLRRHNEKTFIGGMGGPNMVQQSDQPWEIVKGVGHMPSDITLDSESNWVWKSRHGLKTGNLTTGFKHKHTNLPIINFVPWFYVIDGLHSGVLINSQWKWINDLIAILAILLVASGLVRWWRKKWI